MKTIIFAASLAVLPTLIHAETKVEFGNMRLEPVQVRAAQQALVDLGFNPGPVDGALGGKTRNAFAEFSATRGFENDGAFGENEVALLRAVQYNAAHVNDLTSLPLPQQWDINMLSESVLNERSRQGAQISREISGMGPHEDPSLWKDNCVEILSNIEAQVLVEWDASERNEEIRFPITIQGCLEGVGKISSAFGKDDGFHSISTILNSISRSEYLEYISNPQKPRMSTQFAYEFNAITTVLGAHYFIYYDEYNLTDEQRQSIDGFLTRSLQYDIDIFRDSELDIASYPLCRKENIDLIGWDPNTRINGKAVVLPDTCDSMRWKLSVAQILAGLRLNNEALWELGKFNIDLKLNLFDENHIDVPWAAMGGHSIDYSSNVAEFLGLITEIFYSAGFDLLDYKNENGASVAALQGSYWEYANSSQTFRDSKFYTYALRDGRNDSLVSDIENNSLRDLFWINGRNDYMYAIWAHRYADRFDNSILPHTKTSHLKKVFFGPLLDLATSSTFRIVDPELLYLANTDKDNLIENN